MKSKARISDIAKQCGVSISTVSLVLNDKPGVSQETRSRVLEVAAELQYPINPPCPSGNGSNLTTVGMVVKTDPDQPPQANPFYSKVILGIEDACRRSGINLLFATLPVDEKNRPVDAPSILYNDMVDGLLMVGTFVDETIATISKKHFLPMVLVDGYSDSESFDTAVSDNFHAAYQAVKFLIEKGHHHIGLAGGENNCYPSLIERRDGYFRALKDHEISETYTANFNINKSPGYQEIFNLLKENPQITALFCVNDDVASAAIRAAHDLGKNVPEDISIIGYDDTYIAAGSHPALTTMHVDTIALGRAAVHLLSLRVENPDSARMTLTIHSNLVERDSVGLCKSLSAKKDDPLK